MSIMDFFAILSAKFIYCLNRLEEVYFLKLNINLTLIGLYYTRNLGFWLILPRNIVHALLLHKSMNKDWGKKMIPQFLNMLDDLKSSPFKALAALGKTFCQWKEER